MTAAISVVIPAYNGQRFIRETIESVFSQTLLPGEIIVVDDASTDGTPEVVEAIARNAPVPLRLIRLDKNSGGPARPTTVGCQAASGDYVALTDQDDLSLPQRIEKEVALMELNPRLSGCGSQGVVIDGCGNEQGPWKSPLTYGGILAELATGGNPMLHSSMMLRRDALVATGGYSLSYTTAIDLDLWWRMCYEGRLANHGEVLVKYRWHGANSSVLHRNLQWNEAREISTKHLVAYGIARSPSEAAAYITFFSSGADQPPQGNECEITTFAMFTDRLLAFVASLPHCDGEDIREVRRHLRWALIARALRCSRLSLNRYRFLFLSSRLFPEEGGFRSVLSRRLRNFFCGASWAIGSRHVR